MRAQPSRRSMQARLKQCKLLVMDFDGVLTDNTVHVDEHGIESVSCSRSDGLGIEILRMCTDVEAIILSRETNPITVARAKKLRIPAITGCDHKSSELRKLINEKALKPDAVVYIGNDLNDLECMKIAGLSVAVADSASQILRAADYVTQKKGGRGAVREICDLVVSAKQAGITDLLK